MLGYIKPPHWGACTVSCSDFCSGATAPYTAAVCKSLLLAHVVPLRGSRPRFIIKRYWPAQTTRCVHLLASWSLFNQREKYIYNRRLMKCCEILINEKIWDGQLRRAKLLTLASWSATMSCQWGQKEVLLSVFFLSSQWKVVPWTGKILLESYKLQRQECRF